MVKFANIPGLLLALTLLWIHPRPAEASGSLWNALQKTTTPSNQAGIWGSLTQKVRQPRVPDGYGQGADKDGAMAPAGAVPKFNDPSAFVRDTMDRQGNTATFELNHFRMKPSVSVEKAKFFQIYSGKDGFKVRPSIDPKTNQFIDSFAEKNTLPLPATDFLDQQPREITHYQQYHRGLMVIGAGASLQTLNGRVERGQVSLVEGLNIDPTPKLTMEQGAEFAKGVLQKTVGRSTAPNGGLSHPIPNPAAGDSTIKATPPETPVNPLAIACKDLVFKPGNCRLVYRIEVSRESPLEEYEVYVDANNGEIVDQISRIQYDDGSDETMVKAKGWDSTHPKEFYFPAMKSAEGKYRLACESGIAEDVECLADTRVKDCRIPNPQSEGGAFEPSCLDFADDNNNGIFGESSASGSISELPDREGVAVYQAINHTFQTFLKFFAWKGLDGAGKAPAKLFIERVDSPFAIAFFRPATGSMIFDPLKNNGFALSPEVVAHETIHAVIQNSSGFLYIGEGAAINEGLADAFGSLIQWERDNNGSIENCCKEYSPKKYQKPDTLGGKYWITDKGCPSGKNCFPTETGTVECTAENNYCDPNHRHGGLILALFGTLASGGYGENDLGQGFEVNGIGLIETAQLIFKMMTTRLGWKVDYSTFCWELVEMAGDKYGKDSPNYISAWNSCHAIGVLGAYKNSYYFPGNFSDVYPWPVHFEWKVDPEKETNWEIRITHFKEINKFGSAVLTKEGEENSDVITKQTQNVKMVATPDGPIAVVSMDVRLSPLENYEWQTRSLLKKNPSA
ncbi:MAG: M4 family metallopeptidase, partial [Deltaproteobacteria bacterium]|nr:M4 family metallopeptidase [Deltaproteobacteria bacterium]